MKVALSQIEAYQMIEKESPGKTSNPPAHQMVKETKIGPSRYLQDNSQPKITKDDEPEKSQKPKDETIHRIGKLEEKLSETILNTLTHAVEDTPTHEKHKIEARPEEENSLITNPLPDDHQKHKESSSTAKTEPSDQQMSKKRSKRTESEDNVGDYSSEKASNLKFDKEDDLEDENLGPVSEIPLKTIASKEGDIFSGLIKKPIYHNEAKEITISTEEISKINSKIYSCISELQLENMRNKSQRVQNSIKSLEGIREQLFAMISAKK